MTVYINRMKGQDPAVEHFKMACTIAENLHAMEIQLLRHEYYYESFGSWLIEYLRAGERFRIVFDGKDREIRLDANLGDWMKANWKEINALIVSNTDEDNLARLTLLMISETPS